MKKGIIIIALLTLGLMRVNASEQITKWAVIYTDETRTAASTSVTLSSNLDMNYTTTKFYWPVNDTNVYQYQGGYVIIPFTIQTPIMSINYGNTVTTVEEECQRWSQTSSNGQTYWNCSLYSSNTNSNTVQDREYITPTTAIKAKLYTKHSNISYNVACFVEDGSFKCPINYGVDWLDYIQIESNVNYGSSTVTKQYKLEITNFIIVEYDTSKSIINNQNQNTDRIQNELNQTQTYTEDMNTNMTGVNETIEYSTQEQNLKSQLDLNTSMLDNMYIDSNTSGFIWDLLGGLRGMNAAIVSLMSTMLGLGIVRLLLNR